MTRIVEVTLVIGVEIDDEYSGSQHAEDIISTAKKTFPTAKIKLLTINIGPENKLLERNSRAFATDH